MWKEIGQDSCIFEVREKKKGKTKQNDKNILVESPVLFSSSSSIVTAVPGNIFAQAKQRCRKLIRDGYEITEDPTVLETTEETTKGYFLAFDADPTSSSPPHISLSKPFTLRYHEIQRLLQDLSSAVCGHKSFSVGLDKGAIYVNEDRSRSFASLEVSRGRQHIVRLIDSVDKILAKYSNEKFYRLRRPHVSIAWGKGNLQAAIDGDQPQPEDETECQGLVSAEYDDTSEEESDSSSDEDNGGPADLRFHVTEITAKCGSFERTLRLS